MFGKRTKGLNKPKENSSSDTPKLSRRAQKKQAKQQAKEAKTKKKAKSQKNAPVRVTEKERVPADVRLFRWFPRLMAIGIVLICVGFGWIFFANHQAKVAKAAQSMPNGTQLPLYQGTEKGKLTLQNVVLSKNGKQMAASIAYDSDAHTELSSFGKNYGLWVIAPNGYPVKDLHVKYGFFGTDGNAVLQISSDHPLKPQAFVVILVDKAQLVTARDISNGSATTDCDIDQSITAQLSTGSTGSNGANSDSSSSAISNKASMYYVRLNPANAKQANFNWDGNEKPLVEALFINKNLNKIRKTIKTNNIQLKQAKKTLAEYNQRLQINPQDTTAQQGKQSLENTISGLEQSNDAQNKQLKRLETADISKDILGQQQTKFRFILTDKLSMFSNSGFAQ